MTAHDRLLETLVTRRLWVYGGGLAAILVVRTVAQPSALRALAVSFVLAALVATYAAELRADAGQARVKPIALALALAGIVAGCWLALTGRLMGVLFVAGGLLFLGRGLTGGESP